ncbi:MAG: FAD-binding protein [Burkholderiales bacterium]|nr:FAD-binding protein [Burkholderiales bacterium]
MQYDESYDVVVVGFGFAGGVAAIAAADAGARTLLAEKMSIGGGISICAGGGLRIAADADEAYRYLCATNAGATPQPLLRHFAEEMTRLVPYVQGLSKVNGANVVVRERAANYPFPGYDTFSFLEIDSIPGFDARAAYPHAHSLRAGPNVFKVVEDNVRSRPIEVRMSCAARRLVTASGGRIDGIELEHAGRRVRVRCERGVVLACGGFEASAAMQRQYWQLHPVLPAATLGNTGDGVRMAQAAGADLWHMWHLHGSYGFRHPDPAYPFGIRTKRLPDWTPGVRAPEAKMSWILLDRDARRFTNEYQPYVQDTGHRPLDRYDPDQQRFSAIPAYLLVDDVGRALYPLARSIINDPDHQPYEWSQDNLREVDTGLLQRARSVEELARLMRVPRAALAETLDTWNGLCASGAPDPLGRLPATRMPIATPPFYFGEVWPVVSNTQGGPVHDERQRVLNPFGEPIPGLYVAGELGSIWGHLYLSGGNLAECFITGRIAGEQAATN